MARLRDTALFSDPNLMGYWELDNALTDASANSNTLTNVNSATFSSSVKQYGTYSALIDRTNSRFFTAADSASLSITGDMSISLWVNLVSTTSGLFTLVNKWGNTGRSYFPYYQTSNNTLHLNTTNNASLNGVDVSVSWTASTGVWYHIGIVYTAAAGSAKFYINGAQQGSTQTGLQTSIADSTSLLALGVNTPDSGGGSHIFDGYFDDVAIFNRVLTPTEISILYNPLVSGGIFLVNFI